MSLILRSVVRFVWAIFLFSLFSICQPLCADSTCNKIKFAITNANTRKFIVGFSFAGSKARSVDSAILENFRFFNVFHVIHSSSLDHAKSSKCDFFVSITINDSKAFLSIYNAPNSKLIKEYILTYKQASNDVLVDKISNLIYKEMLHEDGIFDQNILLAYEIAPNLHALAQVNFVTRKAQILSYPISYLNDIHLIRDEMWITKFYPKTRTFCLFKYSVYNKQFYSLIMSYNFSVFCPFFYRGAVYLAATNKGASYIYMINKYTPCMIFPSFYNFECRAVAVKKMPNKIATSYNKGEVCDVFCSNFNSYRPKLYINDKMFGDSSGSYYDPRMFEDRHIAAIKIANNVFHLILINLKTMQEKTLFSAYYIGRPRFSKCGNWIAVSFKRGRGVESIALIHRSGKQKYFINLGVNLKIPNFTTKYIQRKIR